MKQVTILFSFLLLAMISLNVQAQIKIPKVATDITKPSDLKIPEGDFSKDILKAINPGSGLDISPDKLLKLTDHNKGFLSDVMGIMGGSGSDADKTKLLQNKQTERKNFITNLLGEGKAAKYYQLIKPQVEPLIKKYALAKFFM